MRSTLPTFTSHTQRTRGGVGFYSDPRTNSRLEEMGCTVSSEGELLPGELRRYSKRGGQGQRFDFFEARGFCARCKKESVLNIVSLCGECSQKVAAEGAAPEAERIATEELCALMLALQEAEDAKAEMFARIDEEFRPEPEDGYDPCDEFDQYEN